MTTSAFDFPFNDEHLKITQSPSGYRYSLDALLIADFAKINPKDRVLDLGAGCGVISMILAGRHSSAAIYGVEISKEQVDIGRQNIINNCMTDRVTLLHQDIKTLTPAMTSGRMDVVISNPPHIEKASGRINPDPRIAAARHEIHVTLKDIMDAARRMLRPAGRLYMIYPAGRMADVIAGMRQANIEPKTLTIMYTRSDAPARRILIEGVNGGGAAMTITPPLFIDS